jgi:hypothetical protein
MNRSFPKFNKPAAPVAPAKPVVVSFPFGQTKEKIETVFLALKACTQSLAETITLDYLATHMTSKDKINISDLHSTTLTDIALVEALPISLPWGAGGAELTASERTSLVHWMLGEKVSTWTSVQDLSEFILANAAYSIYSKQFDTVFSDLRRAMTTNFTRQPNGSFVWTLKFRRDRLAPEFVKNLEARAVAASTVLSFRSTQGSTVASESTNWRAAGEAAAALDAEAAAEAAAAAARSEQLAATRDECLAIAKHTDEWLMAKETEWWNTVPHTPGLLGCPVIPFTQWLDQQNPRGTDLIGVVEEDADTDSVESNDSEESPLYYDEWLSSPVSSTLSFGAYVEARRAWNHLPYETRTSVDRDEFILDYFKPKIQVRRLPAFVGSPALKSSDSITGVIERELASFFPSLASSYGMNFSSSTTVKIVQAGALAGASVLSTA